MLKSGLIALALVTGTAGGALAQTYIGLGGYDVSAFEKHEMDIAVATDKQTGRKFNVVKLPGGKTMILMSSEKVKALSPYADDSEMMYGTHTGTTR